MKLIILIAIISFNLQAFDGLMSCLKVFSKNMNGGIEARSLNSEQEKLYRRLIALGYKKQIAHEIALYKPRLLKRFQSNNENLEPITVYRGIPIEYKNFNPNYKFKKRRYYIAGDNITTYVSNRFLTAVEFAKRKPRINGIVVEYQLPRFMLVDEYGNPAIDLDFSLIAGEYIKDGHLPFIVKVGLLNNKQVLFSAQTKVIYMSDFVSKWIDPRSGRVLPFPEN